jgi:hypothetical protein
LDRQNSALSAGADQEFRDAANTCQLSDFRRVQTPAQLKPENRPASEMNPLPASSSLELPPAKLRPPRCSRSPPILTQPLPRAQPPRSPRFQVFRLANPVAATDMQAPAILNW